MLLLISQNGFSQQLKGIPFIRNYSPTEYGQSPDNWAVAQDKRGVMYFGNSTGVLEYDGSTWSLFPVSNASIVRSIAINKDGVIYVGAVGEFGYLAPNKDGILSYTSLVDLLPINERNFADVWKTYIIEDAVYFQTFTKLIRVQNQTVKVWKPTTSFHLSFEVDGQLFINERGQGLKQLIHDSLLLLPGAEVFKDIRIYSIINYSENQYLIATRENGLWFLDKKANQDQLFREWNVEANNELIAQQVYGACKLKNGLFAFATLQGGVIITDQQGKLNRIINKKCGLRDDAVKFVATDNQDNIWVALANGLAHIEVSSPLTTLNDAQGLVGYVYDIIKFKGILYVATSLGVYGSVNDYFVPIRGINVQSWALKKFYTQTDTLLLVATEAGIAQINQFSAEFIKSCFSYDLMQSAQNINRLFIANSDGVSSIHYENKQWVDEDYLEGIDDEIRSITEDNSHNIWLGTPLNGIFQLNFSDREKSKNNTLTSWGQPYSIHHYDTSQGLPDMQYNIPRLYNHQLVFATTQGLYQFNKNTSQFYPSPLYGHAFRDKQIYRFVSKDSLTTMMFTVSGKREKLVLEATTHTNGKYTLHTQPFLRIVEREIHAIYPQEDGITWLGGPDGVVRYDDRVKKDFAIPYYALIRQVTIDKDSTIYRGYHADSLKKIEIAYQYNSMIFDFSATSYGAEDKLQYSFILEGYDTEWSAWTTKNNKEYTDLREGTYTFKVKAKNNYHVESIESSFSFIILPPWYRTYWAYALYVFLVIGIIYLIIKISVRRLVKAKNQLEMIVKERTAEVVAQKHLIEEKHKEITDSINYAERIQRSFLATKQHLDINLNTNHLNSESTAHKPENYFVFFKPKDVVSGDFYWSATLSNGHFILATADSTGHGVPGAIMSLLNITSLEKAIEKLNKPHDILNATRKTIIERLKRDGSEEGGKDGMDCSLCVYDLEHNKLQIAAANNPVWIVRAGEVIEVKPDKMPVGKHDRQEESFTIHEFEIQKDDVIYTLTDGFPDQFGGPKAKKFMSKNLRELLAKNAHLPMKEQHQLLETTFNNWVGTLEQIDDVTIIGVRIK